MHASTDPRQWDYGRKTTPILEEPRDLEHLVVSIWCPPDLREPLDVGKMTFRDVTAEEMRCVLGELKNDADLSN